MAFKACLLITAVLGMVRASPIYKGSLRTEGSHVARHNLVSYPSGNLDRISLPSTIAPKASVQPSLNLYQRYESKDGTGVNHKDHFDADRIEDQLETEPKVEFEGDWDELDTTIDGESNMGEFGSNDLLDQEPEERLENYNDSFEADKNPFPLYNYEQVGAYRPVAEDISSAYTSGVQSEEYEEQLRGIIDTEDDMETQFPERNLRGNEDGAWLDDNIPSANSLNSDVVPKKISTTGMTPLPPPFPISNISYQEECKGKCPLKNNLLPKYEPDDGGQLKCPEHNGRRFHSEQGALFEIDCYAEFNGRTMKVETETSLDSCINYCTTVQQCKAVVFIPAEIEGDCYLKFNEGKSHMNPFVMSARIVKSNCQNGVDCERHNRVWEMEQEEARRERHRHQVEEMRHKVEDLRRQREELEKERHKQRMRNYHDQMEREDANRQEQIDRARWREFVRNEEEYDIKQAHRLEEKQRDQIREQRRHKWTLAQNERERERLRHQVEREREALEREMDVVLHHEWNEDEAWWRTSRERIQGSYEIAPEDIGRQYFGFEEYIDGPYYVPADDFVFEGDYPTDDEWRWYPDQSWQGYWDVEVINGDIYEGWITEAENDEIRPWGRDDWREFSYHPYSKRAVEEQQSNDGDNESELSRYVKPLDSQPSPVERNTTQPRSTPKVDVNSEITSVYLVHNQTNTVTQASDSSSIIESRYLPSPAQIFHGDLDENNDARMRPHSPRVSS